MTDLDFTNKNGDNIKHGDLTNETKNIEVKQTQKRDLSNKDEGTHKKRICDRYSGFTRLTVGFMFSINQLTTRGALSRSFQQEKLVSKNDRTLEHWWFPANVPFIQF